MSWAGTLSFSIRSSMLTGGEATIVKPKYIEPENAKALISYLENMLLSKGNFTSSGRNSVHCALILKKERLLSCRVMWAKWGLRTSSLSWVTVIPLKGRRRVCLIAMKKRLLMNLSKIYRLMCGLLSTKLTMTSTIQTLFLLVRGCWSQVCLIPRIYSGLRFRLWNIHIRLKISTSKPNPSPCKANSTKQQTSFLDL